MPVSHDTKPAGHYTQPERILVITWRYLGDTLLVTPLIRSLKNAYPDARIDVLLPAGNVGMLAGNPDIASLITVPVKPSVFELLALIKNHYKRYDLAIATQASDRPALLAALSGKISAGFVVENNKKAWWIKRLLTLPLVFAENHRHAVIENLRFCELLNIDADYTVSPPQTTSPPTLPVVPYVVLHIMPQWRFKQWHAAGWLQLMHFFHERGYGIVFTGSPHAEEQSVLRGLQQQSGIPLLNLAGQLSLAELTHVIGHAKLFVGPDTGITHLAAATGTLTFALFGPTDPARWAPWPSSHASATPPFASWGSQRVGNVYLLQGYVDRSCLPCQQEGCEKHRNSHSHCLDQLSARFVIDSIDTTLGNR
ncbi:MAG: glycosyltransferase family 9 protein [Methylomonas sp.]|nr:glycosyltransferase family 9 protein [Methylomonas sp.]PPD22403.1 MAG: glycosyl transferase [Methylomonas sp.]PPD24457.1 MAG: glycosyl transferase [Methylomonas sp.]PPD33082.1 MAG: glycosyl transferase [Methylomonas sp.]PPD42105.1 MAG: glycosyl transferase [Methylomonas sp.]